MRITKFWAIAIGSYVVALSSLANGIIPGAYWSGSSLLQYKIALLLALVWCGLVVFGFITGGLKGFWLLIGLPFVILTPAAMIVVMSGGLSKM